MATPQMIRQSLIPQPTVSFVIAAGNAAPYIHKAIRSILDQPAPPFDLVIIDNASTDDTINIIRRFDDPRITLLHLEKQTTVSEARNLACEHIHAPWMCVFDACDVMLPNTFSPFFQYISSQSFAQCGYCALQFTDAAGHSIEHEMRNRFDFIKMLRTNILPHPMALIKTNLFRKIGGYDNRLNTNTHYDLWLKILEWTDPVFYNKYGVACRRHSENSDNDHSEIIRLLQQRIRTAHPSAFAEHRRNIMRIGLQFWDAADRKDNREITRLAQTLDLTGIRSFVLDHYHARALIQSRRFSEAIPLCDYWIKFLQAGGFLNAAEAVNLCENALLSAIGSQNASWLQAVIAVADFTQRHLHAPVLKRYLKTAQAILEQKQHLNI